MRAIYFRMSETIYNPPIFLRNGHLQTIYPHYFRKADPSFYTRERIDTPDDDFIDIDWALCRSDQLAIISHGLEGSSHRPYVVGMARALNQAGWDSLAWNYRSCSGEINRQLRFYHNGATDDLDLVIQYALKRNRYKRIALIGFSMGGNLTLLYLGHAGQEVNPAISKAIAFSVPCDLRSSSIILARISNKMYMKRFLKSLHQKVQEKMILFPDEISDKNYKQIKNFKHFDDRYTAPIHGFKNAEDYWEKCSCKPHLKNISIPTLFVNAENDPFLSPECYPVREAALNDYLKLEIPKSGGHAGFVSINPQKIYWSESRTIRFLYEE